MRLALTTLLVLALALAGCANKEEGPAASTTTTPTSGGSDMAMTAEDIQVTVGEGGVGVPPALYTLSPKKLELKVGMMYNLTLKNTGRAAHDLVIEGLDVKIPNTAAGQTSEGVMFTPTEAGTFAMYCTIGMPASHKDNGMKGEVVVS